MSFDNSHSFSASVESQEGLKLKVRHVGHYVYPLGGNVESQEGLKQLDYGVSHSSLHACV